MSKKRIRTAEDDAKDEQLRVEMARALLDAMSDEHRVQLFETFKKVHTRYAESLVRSLTNEQRLELFNLFCLHCGCDDPTCQCSNDE